MKSRTLRPYSSIPMKTEPNFKSNRLKSAYVNNSYKGIPSITSRPKTSMAEINKMTKINKRFKIRCIKFNNRNKSQKI